MASLAKELYLANKEKVKTEAISTKLKAKLQFVEEKLALSEKERVNVVAMVSKSGKLFRDLINLKKCLKSVVAEQSPKVAALTEAFNNKLQQVQDLEPFIKVAAEWAISITTEAACNKLLEKVHASLDEMTTRCAGIFDKNVSN